MMKKLLALAAAALLLLTAGCNNNPAEPEPKPDPEYPVTVGNVTLTEAPTAVVSLSPATTEMVYDLGYGELLVGVSEYCTAPGGSCRQTPDGQRLPAGGGKNKSQRSHAGAVHCSADRKYPDRAAAGRSSGAGAAPGGLGGGNKAELPGTGAACWPVM